jgi:serine/threonine protein kinase
MGEHDILSLPPGISSKDIIGWGTSGVCFRYPGEDKVIKIPLSIAEEGDRCKIEEKVYERLQLLPNRPASILTYYGRTKYGIKLAFARHGSIRQYRENEGQISERLLYKWALQAAEALSFCHSIAILHSDFSCNNCFIDASLDLHVADFSGSSIDNKSPLVFYSSSHRRPCKDPVATVQTEIFAFGSFLYELATGTEPAASDRGLQVYPDVTHIEFGEIALACWNGQFHDMLQVSQKIREESSLRGTSNFSLK